jgi:hypothetical protein
MINFAYNKIIFKMSKCKSFQKIKFVALAGCGGSCL